MKSKNNLLTIYLIICLIFIAGWFYWFQWRPTQIRKECLNEVKEKAKDKTTLDEGNYLYGICLISRGLKIEKLLDK